MSQPILEVKFENVGRRRASWTAKTTGPDLEFAWLYRQVKKNAALGSKLIDFSDPDEAGRGNIYVGGFRRVGSFVVSEV